MNNKDYDWKSALSQLFAATVNQQTLEEAAELMVSVSVRDPDYHQECLLVLDAAIHANCAEHEFLISSINKSGYQVITHEEACDLLREFRTLYLQEFQRVMGKGIV